MISTGSQIMLCDIPIRYDTYRGCSHACSYCFGKGKGYDISNVKADNSLTSLKKYVSGHHKKMFDWMDNPLPLHFGGMSDPFQPLESEKRLTYESLKIINAHDFPCVISTKGKLIIEPDYLDLIKNGNYVIQISMLCSEMDRHEQGAPSYNERLAMAETIAKHKRVVVRLQPFLPQNFRQTLANIKRFKDAGVFGVTIEGLKLQKKTNGMVRVGADYVFPLTVLKPMYQQIKDTAHDCGLHFYSAENRLRIMGDDLCCCGIDGMGWNTNKGNLNHIYYGTPEYGDGMKTAGKNQVFVNGCQSTMMLRAVNGKTYQELMESISRSKSAHIIMGKTK